MGKFENIGRCFDVILSCSDQELEELGCLEYVKSLRVATSTPQWGQIETMFAIIADAIESAKKG